MRTPSFRYVALAFFAGALLLASCSNDDGVTSDPEGQPATTAASGEEVVADDDEQDEDAPSSDGFQDIDVCTLLTWEEVESWTGFPQAPGYPEATEGMGGQRLCTWLTEPDPEGIRSRSVIANLVTSTEDISAREMVEALINMVEQDPVVDTSGIPGQVFTTDGFGSGTIIDDDLAVIADTFGVGGDPTEDTTEEQQQIQFDALRAMLDRIGVG